MWWKSAGLSHHQIYAQYYRTHCEVKITGDIVHFHQQGAVLVEGSVIHWGPALWQGAVGLSHHPVGLEDLVQVLCQAGAVVDHHSEFLHLKEKSPYNSSACVLEPAYLHACKPANVNLCESPPVHIGASNKNMLPVNDPKLAVEDPPGQAAKVHPPHINSFRQETQKSHTPITWKMLKK